MAFEESDKGDHLMATKLLTTAIKIDPNNFELYLDRAICNHKLGDYLASLEDADAAIRLNPDKYTCYYQKALALIGLSKTRDAVRNFKKAIELRARQEESKLSELYNLLKNATEELHDASRKRPRQTNLGRTDQDTMNNTVNSDTVDSTTDRTSILLSSQDDKGTSTRISNSSNKVSSSASSAPSPDITSPPHEQAAPELHHIHHDDRSGMGPNQLEVDYRPQFEWKIRRSERIFLHATQETLMEPGQKINLNSVENGRDRTLSTSSSLNSRSFTRGNTQEQSSSCNMNINSPQIDLPSLPRNSTPCIDQDVNQINYIGCNRDGNVSDATCSSRASSKRKRSMAQRVLPPIISNLENGAQPPTISSMKNKRIKRDKERARRGTTKVCTITLEDLEGLKKSLSESTSRRFMRVIAPIDGWLYAGQLNVEHNESAQTNEDRYKYVVHLDGDRSQRDYIFSQAAMLNDVIKEVRVNSIMDLRKGARICCYWSRQYKCLSTGVVTSRTFAETKSLVSVKYDNGDLSALPLDDLRLLPPDYPKYMSNCDPLVLDQSGAGMNELDSKPAPIMVDCHQSSVTKTILVPTTLPEETLPEADHNCSEDTIRPGTSKPSDNSCAVKESEDNAYNFQDKVTVHTKSIPLYSDSEDADDEDGIDVECGDSDDETDNDIIDDEESDQESLLDDPAQGPSNKSLYQNKQNRMERHDHSSNGRDYEPWQWVGLPKRMKRNGRVYKEIYQRISRGLEVIKIGDSAELMPKDSTALPFVAKIDAMWANSRGEMRVRVRWYYRLMETEGESCDLRDPDVSSKFINYFKIFFLRSITENKFLLFFH